MNTHSPTPTVDFPAGLAQPALRALHNAAITGLEQLAGWSEDELLGLHGIGPKAAALLGAALRARGLSFRTAAAEPVSDSPTEWVRSHIQKYVESGGEEGYLFRGAPILLLTTRGRKSGQLRRTALIFGRDGANYLIVASKGGAPEHPNWYLNLRDNPDVEIQVKAQLLKARARTASPEEKARLWPVMTAVYAPYDEYQAATRRDIPLVILEPL